MEEMVRPPPPSVNFKSEPPSFKDLRMAARKKRNGAKPSFSSISYVPFKKCSILITILMRIAAVMWLTQTVPSAWAEAFIILLYKAGDPALLSNFRPIAITSTAGKIVFSVLARHMQKFLVGNKFLDRRVQKGFMAGIPGCVEHSFSLHEALREAKTVKRQIVAASWIDLEDAYGKVSHNLVQFALWWYHVPLVIRKIIFDYYDKLQAKVCTKEWEMDFFDYLTGLFQGCVMSCVMSCDLFNLAFQLLLDLLKPRKALGYSFKRVNVVSLAKAYADDLSFVTKCPQSNQAAL